MYINNNSIERIINIVFEYCEKRHVYPQHSPLSVPHFNYCVIVGGLESYPVAGVEN